MRQEKLLLTGELSYSGTVNGYEVSATLSPNDERLEIELKVKKMLSEDSGFAVVAEGFLQPFLTTGRVEIHNNETALFEAGNDFINAQLHVRADAVKMGVTNDILDIPVKLEFPIHIGPVPLVLRVKLHLNILLILDTVASFAEAETTIQYSSTQGFSVNKGAMIPKGILQSSDVTDVHGGAGAFTAAGMSACLEFPRLELGMRGELASVGFSNNTCVSSTFVLLSDCLSAEGSLTGIALANLSFFGLVLAEGKVELYHTEEVFGECE